MNTNMLHLLLLLGLLSSALSISCPDEEALGSCSCDEYGDELVELVLSCGEEADLDEMKKALGQFDRETALAVELDGMKIGHLPSDIFDGFNVRTVSLSHCELDGLTEEGGRAFSGLEDSLEELDITGCFSDDSNPTVNLGHLRALKKIDLAFNAIDVLGNDWFQNGPDSITDLILSNNGIEELGDKAFVNLPNLEVLWLDGNRFGTLKRSTLPNPANNLDNLELDNNAFRTIPEDLFSNMPALTTVTMRNNGIQKLQQSALESIWPQLDIFDVRGNPIECDSQIDWILHATKSPAVYGTCFTPEDKRGLDIEDLIESKEKY